MAHKNRLVEWLLCLVMVVVGGCELLPTQTDNAFGTRVDFAPMGYISVIAGVVHDCTNTECIQMASFGEGQPLTVVGMIYADSGWWYVVVVQRGLEGFVPSAAMEYDYRLNITPTPTGHPNLF